MTSKGDKRVIMLKKINFLIILLLSISTVDQVLGKGWDIQYKDIAVPNSNGCPELMKSLDNICRQHSCLGVCGIQYEFCSCDEVCLLIGDCCSDFDVACPDLAEQGRLRKQKDEVRIFTCQQNEHLVVIRCPVKLFHEGNLVSLVNEEGITEIMDVDEEAEISRKGAANISIERERSSTLKPSPNPAMVVDSSTGLLYANEYIFTCNGNDKRYMELYSEYQTKVSVSHRGVIHSEGNKPVRLCSAPGEITCPRLYLEQNSSCIIETLLYGSVHCGILNDTKTNSTNMTVQPMNTKGAGQIMKNKTLQLLISDANSELEDAHKNVKCHLASKMHSFWGLPDAFQFNLSATKVQIFNHNNGMKSEDCQTETNYLNKSCFPHTATVSYGTTNFENDCDFINFRNEILKIVADTMIYWRLSFEDNTPENKEIYSMDFILTQGDYTDMDTWREEWGLWRRQQHMLIKRFYSGSAVPDEVNWCIKYELTDIICYQIYNEFNSMSMKFSSGDQLDLKTSQTCQEEDTYKLLKEQSEMRKAITKNQVEIQTRHTVFKNQGNVIHCSLLLLFIAVHEFIFVKLL